MDLLEIPEEAIKVVVTFNSLLNKACHICNPTCFLVFKNP